MGIHRLIHSSCCFLNTNTVITRQLTETARTLEAEWLASLRGSVDTGTKEDESSTGYVWAAGFRHVTAPSRLARSFKRMKIWCLSFSNFFFLAAANRGYGSSPVYLSLTKHCTAWSWKLFAINLVTNDLAATFFKKAKVTKECQAVLTIPKPVREFRGGIDVLHCHSHSRFQSLDWGHLHTSIVKRIISVTTRHSPAIQAKAECLEIRLLLVTERYDEFGNVWIIRETVFPDGVTRKFVPAWQKFLDFDVFVNSDWYSAYLCCIYRGSLCTVLRAIVGRDSVVGIATRYWLDIPGIESPGEGGWRDFPHLPRPALRPTQPPIQWVPGLFPGAKRPGRGVDHSPLSSAKVEGRVELYICSPSGPSWPVLEWTFYLYLYLRAVTGRHFIAALARTVRDFRLPPWSRREFALLVYYYYCYFLLHSLPLKMGPPGCPVTSLRIYNYSLRNDAEEGNFLTRISCAHANNLHLETTKYLINKYLCMWIFKALLDIQCLILPVILCAFSIPALWNEEAGEDSS